MLKRLFASALVTLLIGSIPAQAQTYPDTLNLIQADTTKVQLLRRADGPDGDSYYVYSEPGVSAPCTGTTSTVNVPKAKPQNMWNMSALLALGTAPNIQESTRSGLLTDAEGNIYRAQLPTMNDLSALRQKHGGLPANWRTLCSASNAPFISEMPDFLSSTRWWNVHYSYNLASGNYGIQLDTTFKPATLQIHKVEPSQVCLFPLEAYHGKPQCFGAGDHRSLGDMNDQASSMIVGRNCSVRLYENSDFGGRSIIYNEDHKAATPWTSLQGMRKQASSMKVRCGSDSTATDSEVCLFEHGNFGGRSICYGTGSYPQVGKYADGGDADNSFSSMMVGLKCLVTLYYAPNLVGSSITYGPAPDGAYKRVDWLVNINDLASSLKVSCN